MNDAPRSPARLTVGISIASYSHLAPGDPAGLFRDVARIAVAVDQAGADLLAVPDHLVQMAIGGGADRPMLEAYTLLGALAALTTSVRLGTFVTPVTLRAPGLLAKAVTTLDVVSGGRAVLGLGAGVNAEEHHAHGLDFPDVHTRMTRLGETLAICRSMFANHSTTFDGAEYRLAQVRNAPRPLQARLPILVGGGGERYTLPLVAEHADIANLPPADDDQLARKLAVLDRELEARDRDPASVQRTAFLLQPADTDALRDRTARLRELGFGGVIIAASTATPDDIAGWVAAARSGFGVAAPRDRA